MKGEKWLGYVLGSEIYLPKWYNNVKSKIERERVKNIVDEKARKSEEGTEVRESEGEYDILQ